MPSIKKYERKSTASESKIPLKKTMGSRPVTSKTRVQLKTKKKSTSTMTRKRPWESSEISHEQESSEQIMSGENKGVKTETPLETLNQAQDPKENTETQTQTQSDSAETKQSDSNKTWTFYGDEWLKEKTPKVYDLTQKFIEDWTSENPTFSTLETPVPLMNWALKQSLQRAKKIESQLEKKGVLALLKMGAFVLKTEVEKRTSKSK